MRKECQAAEQQMNRVKSATAGVLASQIAARNRVHYSEGWRDRWAVHNASVRARNNASDALLMADLSRQDVQKWQQDAQADFKSAVDFFGKQCRTLRQMYDKLQTQYVTLAADGDVTHALLELNDGKARYRLGPSSDALIAVKRLENEENLYTQLKGR